MMRFSRLGAGIVDQALVSAGNLAITVFAAKELSLVEFGQFSLAFSIYLFAQVLTRAVSGDVLMFAPSGQSKPVQARAMWTSLVASGVLAICLVGYAGLIGGKLGHTLGAIGLFLPVLLLQDASRYIHFSVSRPGIVLVQDVIWMIGTIVASLVLIVSSYPIRPWLILLVWTGAAAISLATGVLTSGIIPKPRGSLGFVVENQKLIQSLLPDYLLMGITAYATPILIAAVSTVEAAGQFRAGQTLLGPANVLSFGLSVIAIPSARSMLSVESAKKRVFVPRPLRQSAYVVIAISLISGLAPFAVPDHIGRLALGESWIPALDVVFPLALIASLSAVTFAILTAMRLLNKANTALRVRFIAFPVTVATCLVGGLYGGAVGACWGLAVSGLIAATSAMSFLRGLGQATARAT